VPSGLLKLFLGERSALVLDSQWVIPEILIQEAFDFKFPDLQEALTDLLT
jgi:NAD dependent epimerase/dehydratase family enzyme